MYWMWYDQHISLGSESERLLAVRQPRLSHRGISIDSDHRGFLPWPAAEKQNSNALHLIAPGVALLAPGKHVQPHLIAPW
jgi:hypothetical protein